MIADAVAAVIVLVSTAYAALAGADFGGGIWDLLAGPAGRGAAPRRRIDESITPVWESNHVWLIIAVVVFWTGFPAAFAAIFTTLFIPLSVAALGHCAARRRVRVPLPGAHAPLAGGGVFAIASLLTPFFMGTVIGSVVTGRVRGHGDPANSWVNPTSLLTGALFVAVSAYLAAVYLTVDSERAGDAGLRRYFTRRGAGSRGHLGDPGRGHHGGAAFQRSPGVQPPDHWARAAAGGGLGAGRAAVLVLLALDRTRLARALAVAAVAAVVFGWAIAQYPLLIPPHLTIAAAAPTATETTELLVVGIIVILVAPSFALLFSLAQRGTLREPEA
jgi:cytochrome d ubiquinol oxidase subunit II